MLRSRQEPGGVVVVHQDGIGYEVVSSEPDDRMISLMANQLGPVDADNPPITADDVWHPARPQVMRRIAEHIARGAAHEAEDDSPQMRDRETMTDDQEAAQTELGRRVVASMSDTPSTPMQWHFAAMIERALILKARARAEASAQAAGAIDDLDAVHKRSLDNRSVVEAGGLCGCYYCLALLLLLGDV